jgi:hypothetical protein
MEAQETDLISRRKKHGNIRLNFYILKCEAIPSIIDKRKKEEGKRRGSKNAETR